ncbi:hypothetical protein [Frigidibacter sp. SD6-1]|uniref:hypothetical protein n=1 Tax=Frigidibacter sp. SD6-1 TaxID=3032581 RepID=UPI0024DF4581|nr:hypothetical protein [Frigidibacter sp. SD6-1]
MSDLAQDFEKTGRLWLRAALSASEVESFVRCFAQDGRPGARLDLDEAFAPGAPLARALAPVVGKARAVRAVAFDKGAKANWGAPWHQDRIIAVRGRHEVPGYGNWSCKGGTWHCEPPLALLQGMFFVRLHVDPAHADNGPMEIAVGSHLAGAVRDSEAEARAADHAQESALARLATFWCFTC